MRRVNVLANLIARIWYAFALRLGWCVKGRQRHEWLLILERGNLTQDQRAATGVASIAIMPIDRPTQRLRQRQAVYVANGAAM
ncbi:MAG: hypothetical protein P4L10_08760 [Acidobacteriaceae bacterium]|nr:hypothetical protein [Acidobacteriaceae bacterium]